MVEDLYWGLLKVGDWATWAGAVGSAAAAWGAWYAASQALRIAEMPIKEQERERLTKCRSIAPSVGPEFRRAREDAKDLADKVARAIATRQAKELYLWVRGGFIVRTSMIERFADRFDLFGAAAGSPISAAAASVLGLRAIVSKWIETGERFEHLGLNDPDVERLVKLEAEANMVIKQISAIEPLLACFGGSKTEFEI